MSLFSTVQHRPAQPRALVGALRVAFLLMGFTFSITQAVMIRAFLVAFSGNELSIGLVLAGWLILEAAGSGLLGRLAAPPQSPPTLGGKTPPLSPPPTLGGKTPPLSPPPKLGEGPGVGAGAGVFALLQVLLALALPLSLYAALTVRQLVGITPGLGFGLGTMAWASFLILAPLGLVDGAMFTFGCRAFARLQGEAGSASGRVYSLEALGGIAGGLAFTYVFIPYLNTLQVVLALTVLNIGSAVSLVALATHGSALLRRACGPLLALLAVAGYLLIFQNAGLQRWLSRQQWPGYELVFCDDSIYGNVAVIRQGTQYTFFTDGIPVLTVPVPDVALAEELVHLPMLFVAEPRRVLVIGGGAGGVLHQVLKYPVEQVDYAELDPLLIQAVHRFPTQLTEGELSDPRVQVHHVDGRLFIRERLASSPFILPNGGERGGTPYDLILVNVSYPSTLELNRFYTREFFTMSRALLSGEGLLVSRLPGSTEYLSPALRDQHVTLQRTLQAVFPAVRPIPGDTTLWLASPSPAALDQPLDALLSRWQTRDISTALDAGFHFQFKLDPRRLAWFENSLTQPPPFIPPNGGKRGGTRVNEDLHPTGLLHGLAYWNEMFAPHLAGYFRFLHNLRLDTLLLPLIVLTPLALLLLRPTPRRRALTVPLAILSTGFAGMAFDLLIIFAFQSFYGYVYHLIGLLITAFMAGLALGGWWMTRRVERVPASRRLLLGLESLLTGYWCLFPAVLWLLYAHHHRALVSALLGPLLLLLNSLAGLLTGLEFPLANQLLLAPPSSPPTLGGKEGGQPPTLGGKEGGQPSTLGGKEGGQPSTLGGKEGGQPPTLEGKEGGQVSATAGLLYAADLVGACSGALAVSLVLLPALGVVETCLLVVALKGASLLMLAVTPPPLLSPPIGGK